MIQLVTLFSMLARLQGRWNAFACAREREGGGTWTPGCCMRASKIWVRPLGGPQFELMNTTASSFCEGGRGGSSSHVCLYLQCIRGTPTFLHVAIYDG